MINMQPIFSKLFWRDREILKYKYGLYDGKKRTNKELSRIFFVSPERIRQIEKEVFKKIREIIEEDNLYDDLFPNN